jgi:hypothetical protein
MRGRGTPGGCRSGDRNGAGGFLGRRGRSIGHVSVAAQTRPVRVTLSGEGRLNLHPPQQFLEGHECRLIVVAVVFTGRPTTVQKFAPGKFVVQFLQDEYQPIRIPLT